MESQLHQAKQKVKKGTKKKNGMDWNGIDYQPKASLKRVDINMKSSKAQAFWW